MEPTCHGIQCCCAGSLYSNHPYSFLSNANEIACISNDVSNYTSVIFKISSAPCPIQIQRQSCWRWYINDVRTFSLVKFLHQSVPSCPCTEFQAWFDLRWTLVIQNSLRACYISKIVQPFEIGQLCCYDVSPTNAGAPIVNGQYSGGFLLYHPFAGSRGYRQYDALPKALCCSNEVDLCNIFQQRRPLQTCENYQLLKLGKHFN